MKRQTLIILLILVAAVVLGWLAYHGGYWAGAH
jgi:hypothetical protein